MLKSKGTINKRSKGSDDVIVRGSFSYLEVMNLIVLKSQKIEPLA